ncbi:hypothetical protein OROMI_014185 [Orobanche minor]
MKEMSFPGETSYVLCLISSQVLVPKSSVGAHIMSMPIMAMPPPPPPIVVSRFDNPYLQSLARGDFAIDRKIKFHLLSINLAVVIAFHKNEPSIKLSSQCCVDCGPQNDEKEPDAHGCKTTKFAQVYPFAINHGFYEDNNYKYTGEKVHVKKKRYGRRLCIGVKIPEPFEILEAICRQPLTAKIRITPLQKKIQSSG